MSWEAILSWWLAGGVFGLNIANLLVHDEVMNCIFLMIALGFIIIELCILLWVVIRKGSGW